MSRRLFFQIFGCVLFFMVGQYDRIDSNLVKGRGYFRGRKVTRFRKIIKTQLSELMLTTFYLACFICVKQKWAHNRYVFGFVHCSKKNCRDLTNLQWLV